MQIIRHVEILDFVSIKFRNFEPNLHFVGIKLCEEKKKPTFQSHENDYYFFFNQVLID